MDQTAHDETGSRADVVAAVCDLQVERDQLRSLLGQVAEEDRLITPAGMAVLILPVGLMAAIDDALTPPKGDDAPA